jgi:hypothetical protein
MEINLFSFDNIDRHARMNGDYSALTLCSNGNAALELASDGTTARVMVRVSGEGWCAIHAFQVESWKGNHWSDIDIDNALYGDYGLASYMAGEKV